MNRRSFVISLFSLPVLGKFAKLLPRRAKTSEIAIANIIPVERISRSHSAAWDSEVVELKMKHMATSRLPGVLRDYRFTRLSPSTNYFPFIREDGLCCLMTEQKEIIEPDEIVEIIGDETTTMTYLLDRNGNIS